MKPGGKRTSAELRVWANGIITRAQERQLYGTVTFHLEAGTIVRSTTNESELPTFDDKKPLDESAKGG